MRARLILGILLLGKRMLANTGAGSSLGGNGDGDAGEDVVLLVLLLCFLGGVRRPTGMETGAGAMKPVVTSSSSSKAESSLSSKAGATGERGPVEAPNEEVAGLSG